MMPRILGGTLFGGPIGAGAAIVNAALSQETGKDIGEHVVALFNENPPSSALAAKPNETDMVTAAGSNKKISVAAEPLAALGAQSQMSKSALVKPTLAELEILQTELRGNQAAQISFLETPPNQKRGPIQIQAQAQAQTKAQVQTEVQTQLQTLIQDQEDKANVVARSAAPEKQILALENAVERFQHNRRTPQRAALNATPATPVAAIAPAPTNAATRAPLNEVLAFKTRASSAPAATESNETKESRTSKASPSQWISFQPTNPKISTNTAGTPPLGALAANGGWFSDVMVSAMTKYEQGKQLKLPVPASSVYQLN